MNLALDVVDGIGRAVSGGVSQVGSLEPVKKVMGSVGTDLRTSNPAGSVHAGSARYRSRLVHCSMECKCSRHGGIARTCLFPQQNSLPRVWRRAT